VPGLALGTSTQTGYVNAGVFLTPQGMRTKTWTQMRQEDVRVLTRRSYEGS